MGKCKECNGTGNCINKVHDNDDIIEEILSEPIGNCPDCGQQANDPGICWTCDGIGCAED